MEIWQSIVLGIVEGLTEFLPISSTGHLLLAEKFLGLDLNNQFLDTYTYAIQFGAVLAVITLYWRRFRFSFVRPQPPEDSASPGDRPSAAGDFYVDFAVMWRVGLAFLVSALIGLPTHGLMEEIPEKLNVTLWSFLIGGNLIIAYELFLGERRQAVDDIRKMKWWQAAGVGAFQCIAMIPGVSRSAATIFGGMALGMRRRTIVEFTFLLAIPTLTGAAGLKLFKTFVKQGQSISLDQAQVLIIGTAVSFVVAMLVMVVFLRYIKTHSFIIFGIYRIVLALAAWYWIYTYLPWEAR